MSGILGSVESHLARTMRGLLDSPEGFTSWPTAQGLLAEMRGGGEGLTPGEMNEVAGRFLDFVTPMSGLLGTIAGKFARTSSGDALKHAYKMKAMGKGEDEIFRETTEKYGQGWWLEHPDTKPRFELDDSGMALVEPKRTANFYPLSDVVTHPEAYKAYPPLKTHLYSRRNEPGMAQGSFDAASDNINVSRLADNPLSTTGHELQHAISNQEGFAKGGSIGGEKLNTDVWTPYRKQWGDFFESLREAGVDLTNAPAGPSLKFVDDIDDYINDLVFQSGRTGKAETLLRVEDEAEKLLKALSNADPYASYHRLADESQARLTQERLGMTSAQRAADPFYKHYDVPLEDMVLKY